MLGFLKKTLKVTALTTGVVALGSGTYGFLAKENLIDQKYQKPYWQAFAKWSEYRGTNTFTGRQFNGISRVLEDDIMVKVLSKDLKHYEHTYQDGLNVDAVPFNPEGNCRAGGLYFTASRHVHNYFSYGPSMGRVTIPDDAQVYCETNKCKADKFILSNIALRLEHPLVKENPKSFNLNEFMLDAVTENCWGHQYDSTVENLLDLGADPNYRHVIDYSITHDNKNLAKILLKKGATTDHLSPWAKKKLNEMVGDVEAVKLTKSSDPSKSLTF